MPAPRRGNGAGQHSSLLQADARSQRDQQRRGGSGVGARAAAVQQAPAGSGPMDRKAFTARLVEEIRQLEGRRAGRSEGELADAAWRALQFDFPIVGDEELTALEAVFRRSLGGKFGAPPYRLTRIFVENITNGARDPAPPPSDAPKQAGAAAAEGSSGGDAEASSSGGGQAATTTADITGADAAAATTTSSSSGTAGGDSLSVPPGEPAPGGLPTRLRQRRLYQRLCCGVLLQLGAKLIASPEQEAWQHLSAYQPEQPHSSREAANGASNNDSSSGGGRRLSDGSTDSGSEDLEGQDERIAEALARVGLSQGDVEAAALQQLRQPNSHPKGHRGVTRVTIEELPAEAAEQDSDGEPYEDLDPLPITPTAPSGFGAAAAAAAVAHQQRFGSIGIGGSGSQAAAAEEPFSWDELKGRLLDLGGWLEYPVVSDPWLWTSSSDSSSSGISSSNSSSGSGGAAAAHLFALLRALGVHPRSDELLPLLHAGVAVLVERAAAEPSDIPLLSQLWDALGVAAPPSAAAPAAGHRGPLPGEALVAFGAAAALRQRLTAVSARRRLRAAVHAHLLPLLERSLEQLAYGGGGQRFGGPGAGPGAGGAADGERLAQALLLSHVIEAYVSDRPAGCDAGAALAASGALRSLVQLFVSHAATPAAEPIRRALLLTCASSRHACSWALAVPAFTSALALRCFAPGGAAEAHGSAWQLLSSGGTASGHAEALLSAPAAAAPAALRRTNALLALLADAQAAGGSGGAALTWGPGLDAALRQLSLALREEGSSAVAAATTAAAGSRGEQGEQRPGGSGGDNDRAGPCGDSSGDDEEGGGDVTKLRAAPAPGDLEARLARQLRPACLRLVKQLLAGGGGGAGLRGGKTD